MLGIINYQSFILSAVLLNITPGADTIYILTKSATGGRSRGIVSALGICTGILVHTVLAALGLSAVLSRSAAAFNLMKLLGAAYLVVMGIRTALSKEPLFPTEADGQKREGLWTVYRQGVLTNVLNPKVALFFLALLPQFVEVGSHGPVPFLLLGLTFCTTGTLWSVFVAFIASFLSRALQSSLIAQRMASKVTGMIYILLGLNILRAKAES